MTYAPETLLQVRRFLLGADADLSAVEVGIAGGPSHVATGTSYHLGKDQLKMEKNPYSARTARDKAGLADPEIANAACALDIDDDWDELRPFSVWLVEQCRAGAPDTLDIREIIYSPDGKTVYTWDREKGVTSPPEQRGSLSHLTHTHIGFYRDSTRRPKLPVFQRYYLTPIQAKGPTMFLLQVKNTAEVFISNGINTRPVPGGQWGQTCERLIAAGTPFINDYSNMESLLDGGGPLVEEVKSLTFTVPATVVKVDLEA